MSSGDFITLHSGTISARVATDFAAGTASTASAAGSVVELCRMSLAEPIEFPPLSRCAVPDDLVVIAVDPEVPALVDIIAIVVEQMQAVPEGGVRLTLLLPDDSSGAGWAGLIESLPLHLREQMSIVVHQPEEPKQLSYLASSAAGDRLYMNTALVDADLIVSIGLLTHDSVLGIRGTTSGLFPIFSNLEARGLFVSQDAQTERTSPAQRRELVDEVGWLLGTQYTIQVLPAAASSGPVVISGAVDDVLNHGRELLRNRGRVCIAEPLECVIVSIPGTPSLEWKQLGAALDQVVRIVEEDGRIIVVAALPEPTGPAATMLRRCLEPDELLKPLEREPVVDSFEFAQLIRALDHARVFLFSELNSEVVEELRMVPVSSPDELARLFQTCDERPLAIPNANYACCEIAKAPVRSRAKKEPAS